MKHVQSFQDLLTDYGNIREIGIATSCKTAGELMLSYKDELTFDTVEDNSLTLEPNDIDAYTYMQLRQARIVAFWNNIRQGYKYI